MSTSATRLAKSIGVMNLLFARPYIGANCFEGLGPLLAPCALKNVHLGHQLHVDESDAPQQLYVLSIQESTAYSIGPQVDLLTGPVWNRLVDHDVGQVQPPAGF